MMEPGWYLLAWDAARAEPVFKSRNPFGTLEDVREFVKSNGLHSGSYHAILISESARLTVSRSVAVHVDYPGSTPTT